MISSNRITKGHGKLVLNDELTIYVANDFKKKLEKYVNTEKCQFLSIDMSEVSEIDTACLQILIQLKREFTETGRELRIVSHSSAVIELFELYNLGSFFGDQMVLAS